MRKMQVSPLRKLISASVLLLLAAAAYSQTATSYDDLVAALRQAAAEKNDGRRLTLYDTIVRDFGIAENSGRLTLYDTIVRDFGIAENSGKAADISLMSSSKWMFDQQVDPLTDKRRYFFMLTADSGTNEYGEKPTLIIRSDGEDLELYINWKTYLGNDSDDFKYEKKYVTIRVDSSQPTISLWDNSTDHKASFCPWTMVLDLVRRLGEGTTFVARCTPYGANPITAVFDIRGLKALSMSYNDVLGWWR